MFYKMRKNEFFIGIDIGGTNTTLGLVNHEGKILKKHFFSTFADQPITLFISNLEKIILQLVNEMKTVRGIGVGMPGINSKTGLVDKSVNFSWGNINLGRELKNKFKLPVFIINDAKAAALGEMAFGKARDLENFIMITLGTGLGSCFVFNRQVINGFKGMASELGHTKIANENRRCGCGKLGCLETFASASGVCRSVFEIISYDKKKTPLLNYSFNEMTAEIVTQYAAQGDETALKAYEKTGMILGEKLADFINVFSPEAILFSGGLVAAGKFLFEPMERAIAENLLFKDKIKTQIRISDPNVNYAVLGAATLLMNRQER
jgi:glucokinase